MASAASAIEAAAYAALDSDVTLAPVFQHVPEDTDPPLVIVADLDEDAEAFGDKDGGDDGKFTLTVASLFRGEQRKPLFEIEAEVRAALDQLRVADQDGFALTFLFSSREGSLLEDGVTYLGNSRFTVFALKN